MLHLLLHLLAGLGVLVLSSVMGILGYHGYEQLSWFDSLLNASMILGAWGR